MVRYASGEKRSSIFSWIKTIIGQFVFRQESILRIFASGYRKFARPGSRAGSSFGWAARELLRLSGTDLAWLRSCIYIDKSGLLIASSHNSHNKERWVIGQPLTST